MERMTTKKFLPFYTMSMLLVVVTLTAFLIDIKTHGHWESKCLSSQMFVVVVNDECPVRNESGSDSEEHRCVGIR